jgi:nucleotide-binding universal stress UspA family protein
MNALINGRTTGSVVLVGIDFSPLSEDALRIAAAFGDQSSDLELHLVHVVPSLPAGDFRQPPADAVSANATITEDVSAKLDDLGARLAPFARRVIAHVRIGRPDGEIAQLASDIHADLVVVGAQEKRGFIRSILGSVAHSLVRIAPCPVLTCRSQETPLSEQIEPRCIDCLSVQRESDHARLWCARHSQHHPRAHTYHAVPPSFAMGSQTFRPEE